ncbi:MAG: hypothetical protein ABIH82_02070 [Candidatus Woesearchaeota archaeon]
MDEVVEFKLGEVGFVMPVTAPDIYVSERNFGARPYSAMTATERFNKKLFALGTIIGRYVNSLPRDSRQEDTNFNYTLLTGNPQIDIAVSDGKILRFNDPYNADEFLRFFRKKGTHFQEIEIVRDFLNKNKSVIGYFRSGVDHQRDLENGSPRDLREKPYCLETKIWLSPELKENDAFYEKLECAANMLFADREMRTDVNIARVLDERLREMGIPLYFDKE